MQRLGRSLACAAVLAASKGRMQLPVVWAADMKHPEAVVLQRARRDCSCSKGLPVARRR